LLAVDGTCCDGKVQGTYAQKFCAVLNVIFGRWSRKKKGQPSNEYISKLAYMVHRASTGGAHWMSLLTMFPRELQLHVPVPSASVVLWSLFSHPGIDPPSVKSALTITFVIHLTHFIHESLYSGEASVSRQDNGLLDCMGSPHSQHSVLTYCQNPRLRTST